MMIAIQLKSLPRVAMPFRERFDEDKNLREVEGARVVAQVVKWRANPKGMKVRRRTTKAPPDALD